MLRVDCPNFPKSLLIFHERIYKLVDDPSTDSIISWSKSNMSFIIWNQEELIRRKMLSRFYSDTFPEFISRLKHYGFKQVKGPGGQLEFGNKNFVRGHPEFLAAMRIQASIDKMKAKSKAEKKAKAEAEVKDRLEKLRI